MDIKKFNNFLNENVGDIPAGTVMGSDFHKMKEDMIIKIGTLMKEYYNFTKEVSPNNWRTTGTHYSNLRKMKEEIQNFDQITDEQKEIGWVKKELNNPHGLED